MIDDDDIISEAGLMHFYRNVETKDSIKINNYKMFNSHNLKILGGLAIVFVIAGLQAIKGYSIPYGSTIDGVVSFLLFLEHSFYGKTE